MTESAPEMPDMRRAKPRVVAVIPARLQSSRLPEKALVDILGLPMIVHVDRRCRLASSLDAVYVATDSERIRDVVIAHGGEAVMTSSRHQTGTDRLAEAVRTIECDIVVNVQGDEALVRPEHIDAGVAALRRDAAINVSMLVNPFRTYESPSAIKAVVNDSMEILYLSRADIPSGARTPHPDMLKAYHIVSFRKPFLLAFTQWPQGILERIEYNEYLRILEQGHRMRAVRVESSAVSVDTPEDLDTVRRMMERDALLPLYRSASGRGAQARFHAGRATGGRP